MRQPRTFRRATRRCWGRQTAFALLLAVLLAIPASAQEPSKIPVVIDGAEVFRVGSTEEFAATERAQAINQQLHQAVTSPELPLVEVAGDADLPTLVLNGNHLLTVTASDTPPGRTRLDQARIWANELRDQIRQAQQQRQPDYLWRALVFAAAALILATGLHWGLGRFWQHTLRPELHAVTQRPGAATAEDRPASLNLLLSLLLFIARTAVWLGAGFYLMNLFPWTRQWGYQLMEILSSSFMDPIFTLGNSRYSVISLLILLVLFFALEIATKTVTNVLKVRVLRMTVANRGAREAIAILIRYGLLFLGSLVLLQVWGIDISSLAILASALGLGIGLGLQDIAKDFGSGLVLLFERPIQVGDFVQVGDFLGTIERIGTRSTLIRTLDHISIIVPNSRFLSGEVINWSHDNPVSRLRLPVGVAYGSNMEQVRQALLAAAKASANVLSQPPPQVFFRGFGDSALELELLVWTAEPSKQLLIKSELYFNIEAQLRQHEVEIPFPQRDLNLRTGTLPIELPPDLTHSLQQWLRQTQNGK